MKSGPSCLLPGVAAALFALLPSCASAPGKVVDDEEELKVIAFTTVEDPPGEYSQREILGAECALRNDKGAWKVTTPGAVKVRRSIEPLQVDCTREGYARSESIIPCRRPGQGAGMTTGDKVQLGLVIAMIPLGIAVAPIAPQLSAQAAGQVLMYGVGFAASHTPSQSGSEQCYGAVFATFVPEPRAGVK